MVMKDTVATVMERDLLKLMLSQGTTEEVMVDMVVDTTERGRLTPNQDTAVDMDMVVMVDMAVDTMERGRLMLNQDTSEEDMAMEAMVMEDTVATVMERDLLKLMLSQDTTEEDMVVMDMDVDTMERGRPMLSPDTLEEDMAVMVVMAMEDMVIAVKFFPLFIVPPPH